MDFFVTTVIIIFIYIFMKNKFSYYWNSMGRMGQQIIKSAKSDKNLK